MSDREEVPFRLAVANRDRERAARNVVSANERNLPYHVLAWAEALELHGHRYMRVRRQSLLKPGDPTMYIAESTASNMAAALSAIYH